MQCMQNIPIIRHSFITLTNYAAPNFCSFLHLPVTSCRLGPYILLNVLFYRHQFVLNDCLPITETRWIMLRFSSSDIRRFSCTPSILRPFDSFCLHLKSNALCVFHGGLVRDFQNILTTSDVHLFGHTPEVGAWGSVVVKALRY
jgi:hypothetical protein